MAYVYQPYPRMLFRMDEHCTVENYSQEQHRVREGWGHVPGWVAPVDDVGASVDATTHAPVRLESEDVADVEPRGVKRGRGRPRKT